ncbi:hypothetical protein EJ08DRAFT_625056 [Tothia fuscella]|uniref:F-box domain-containing protein n=1 Tax=Tothia fuscella TaxID=1048955 RepID=A0A9P4P1D3_9PEZI|nr:hypothetical protein EJ08DRAFT_625056 [Tothia fuscella]
MSKIKTWPNRLPAELNLQVLEFLSPKDLKLLSFVSHDTYNIALGPLWSHVILEDCRSTRNIEQPDKDHLLLRVKDEHDDTPIVQKLLVLARNPTIASKVKKITHKCHLPPPAIFSDLSHTCFEGWTLSNDWRTLSLLRYALYRMDNLKTLRIINGHRNITAVLLGILLQPHGGGPKLERLWLESCSLAAVGYHCSAHPVQLQTLRFRRMAMEYFPPSFLFSREGSSSRSMFDGAGGEYETPVQLAELNSVVERLIELNAETLRNSCPQQIRCLNEAMYDEIPEATQFLDGLKGKGFTWDDWTQPLPGRSLSEQPFLRIMESTTATLTSLNLDWLMTQPYEMDSNLRKSDDGIQYSFFSGLASLKFPHLRALQLRNTIATSTMLASDIYLLHPTTVHYRKTTMDSSTETKTIDMLEFLERHPKLQVLAWPMDRFFSHLRATDEVLGRSEKVILNLGRRLISLRVDFDFSDRGEWRTDISPNNSRTRRRRFISSFAAHMTKLQTLKMEGGIPQDEKRETLRAIHRSPLENLTLIGVSSPIGNTWGWNGEDVDISDELPHAVFRAVLEAENKESIVEGASAQPPVITQFRAQYGWPPSPPLLHTISLWGSTLKELKLCGYVGSPVFHKPTSITPYMIHHLVHLPRLKNLTISCWLTTYFEHDARDSEIIRFWRDQRESSSTALVVVRHEIVEPVQPTGTLPAVAYQMDYPPPLEIPIINPWHEALHRVYSPLSLATRAHRLIAPHLAPEARARGVDVRISFCLGVETTDIFDFNMVIDNDDEPKSLNGPREEGEHDRWWGKLEARQWF